MTAALILAAALAGPSVIPAPDRMTLQGEPYRLTAGTAIVAGPGTEAVARQLRASLRPATGLGLEIRSEGKGLELRLDPGTGLGPEGYEISVSPRGVRMRSEGEAGLFYAAQTLRQLLPVEVFSDKPVDGVAWTVPGVEIQDRPRFAWRGAHMDVARHFMPKEYVLRFLDAMALHKLNTFHFHLTEDQGWRVEIKAYPRLTEVGAWREQTVIGRNSGEFDGKPHGGYYTQDDLREIVAYAKERHITVVPEIEMPGHALAALASYPELSCTGGPFEVGQQWGVFEDVFCAGNDETFVFLKAVLTEVLDIFPSVFIHIGGDEVPKTRWKACPKCQARIQREGLKDEYELQSWFIRQIDEWLDVRGRRLVGWDEILEGGLAPGATVMSWRGMDGGVTAANKGHDTVMAPNSHTYFDHYQSRDTEREPLAIGGFTPIEKVYAFEPVSDAILPDKRHHVLGAQFQLWSEYIPTPEHMDYMAFPRACALAEVVWTSQRGDFTDFRARLETHLLRLERMGVRFRPLSPPGETPIGTWRRGQTGEEWGTLEWDVTTAVTAPGAYDVSFWYTDGAHRLDIRWVELVVDGRVVARVDQSGVTGGETRNNVYRVSVADRQGTAKIVLRASVRSDGGADSNGEVFVRPVRP